MTRDEIIELAKQSGINATADTIVSYGGLVDSFERFANLVAEKEREACAEICDPYTHGQWFAKHIRARGQAKPHSGKTTYNWSQEKISEMMANDDGRDLGPDDQ